MRACTPWLGAPRPRSPGGWCAPDTAPTGASARTSWSPADRQLVKLYVEMGRKAGAGLDSATRPRVIRLFQRHADLERAFALNLAGDSTRIRMPRRDTLGLDRQLRAQLTRDGDSVAVPVNESTFFPFLKHEPDRAARRAFFLASSGAEVRPMSPSSTPRSPSATPSPGCSASRIGLRTS